MKTVHVAVGVIKSRDGKILIAKRPEKSHQGGLWEFPGGKVEVGETLFDALKRELFEELGLKIFSSSPLIKISHDYGDKKVLLDVHWVTDFDAQDISPTATQGKEGQPIEWVDIQSLKQYQFPAANFPILNAIRLPASYAITGEFRSQQECLKKLENILRRDIKLIQLRAKTLDFSAYQDLAQSALELCKAFKSQLQLNVSVGDFQKLNLNDEFVGLHLRSSELIVLQQRPVSDRILLSASCHNSDEVECARNIGVDFICLSPVKKTTSHPDSPALEWENFSKLAMKAACPVYALGGLSSQNLQEAINSGAQGIAAIGAWWGD